MGRCMVALDYEYYIIKCRVCTRDTNDGRHAYSAYMIMYLCAL